MELEQGLERLWPAGDPFPWVAAFLYPAGHGGDRHIGCMCAVDRVPAERRRHLGAGTGAHRPGAEDGLVRSVLVEVDEHPAAALLLPPRRPDELGAAPLELARGRDRCGAHLVGVPPRLEPNVDVEPPVARRLRVAGYSNLGEQRT